MEAKTGLQAKKKVESSSDEDEEESEDEDVAGRYSQSETEESDTELEGRTRVANTAYNKERQGHIKLPDSWRLHPMWRTTSKMEIQMCSCGIETLEENLDPGKQWDGLNEKCKVYQYIGKKLNCHLVVLWI